MYRYNVLLCTQLSTALQVDTTYTQLSLYTCTVKHLNLNNLDLSNPVVVNLVKLTNQSAAFRCHVSHRV